MILIQAIMNPVGIGVGWALSSSGNLVTGIFESISAGIFDYLLKILRIMSIFSKERLFILLLLKSL